MKRLQIKKKVSQRNCLDKGREKAQITKGNSIIDPFHVVDIKSIALSFPKSRTAYP